jgi:hypothetical protein
MHGDFTGNGHMAGNFLSMYGLGHNKRNRAPELLRIQHEQTNGDRWETVGQNSDKICESKTTLGIHSNFLVFHF